jgi:polysaccharide pyruvyl transferase WcaK-like protein
MTAPIQPAIGLAPGVTRLSPPLAIVFANNKGNIGDFAILHAMLIDLERRFPGYPIKVFPHTSLSTDKPRLEAFLASGVPRFEMTGGAFSKAAPAAAKFYYYSGLWPLLRPRIVENIDQLAQPAAAVFRGSAAAFMAGGHQWGGFKGLSMFATLRAIGRLGIPLYAYPFSVSRRMNSIIGVETLRRDFSLFGKPLVLRDSASAEMIGALGLTAVLGADCVYSLSKLANAIAPSPAANHERIIVTLTNDETSLRRQLRGLAQRLKPAGYRIALLTTCELEDGPAMRDVTEEFGLEYLAPLTWQDAVSEMKASRLIISNRLHGLILGSFCGVPLLPVTDRGKVASFVTDNASPVFARDPGGIGAPLLAEGLARRDEILRRLAAYQLKTSSMAMAPVLESLG